MTKQIQINGQELPFWKEIRASWVANNSHCDPNYCSKRKQFIDKGINFSSEWTGEIGFLRYYIFHIDNGYKAGKSKLQRMDKNKGFSPDNCIIVSNGISTNYNSKQKPAKAKCTTKEKALPTNVTTNNFIVVDSTVTDIKAFLSNLFYRSLETNQK